MLLGNGQSLKHAKAIMRNRHVPYAHLHRDQTASAAHRASDKCIVDAFLLAVR